MPSYSENYASISTGINLLVQAMAPYVASVLQKEFGQDWWQQGVLDVLYDDQKHNLPAAGQDTDLVNSMDIAVCLQLMDLHWRRIFAKRLSREYLNWIKEFKGVRNDWAHAGAQEFNDDDTWRALDTLSRLCEPLQADLAEQLRGLLRMSRYGSEQGSKATTAATTVSQSSGRPAQSMGILTQAPDNLPPWREIITPHQDVAQGDYVRAEFAADLAQVARGEGSFEYRDPVEFFSRTYITEGMRALLVQALRRVTTGRGESVLQLKTAFGGGKTHSMLALYHLLRGQLHADNIPSLQPVLAEADITTLPRVHTAVLVGTALDPSRRRPANMPGISISTAWGEIAAQLAYSAGQPKLYDIVREADKKGTPPGSVALRELFDGCGSCLVLMDELVAYARKLNDTGNLPAGSSGAFLTFVQELTEAARASKSSLVVASIPESDIEMGDDRGRQALREIEHTFGRMEAVWKPVGASEGFEIVRRRLFNECTNPQARDHVCEQFSRMYRDNPGDFPLDSREAEYRQRLIACYPIHPEIFDRLYEDWATLDNFQRTRGVLRLMAAVIHELWMGQDQSLLIMPGSLPMDVPNVRDELTRHLSDGWNAIVDKEVDGKNSVPYQTDTKYTRYGKIMAARRVSRTILLGSAPSSQAQKVRGIDVAHIRLGTVQPGESISTFNDVRSALQNNLAYLYATQADDRFWYDTRPTLRKTVADRATQRVDKGAVEQEIERRVRGLKLGASTLFKGLHICPTSSLDVPDNQSARLVLLPPGQSYTPNAQDCIAMTAVRDIFEHRGTTPRKYRNMLVFLAADQLELEQLEKDVRQYLAWKSIEEEKEQLNLDHAQREETRASLQKTDGLVNMRLKTTWCWLLVPGADSDDKNVLRWDVKRLRGGDDSPVSKADRALASEDTIINSLAAESLLLELDTLLWTNSTYLSVKTLWDNLCTYCYLPRLVDFEVLKHAIQDGLKNGSLAYAHGVVDVRSLGGIHNIQDAVRQRLAAVNKDYAEVAEDGLINIWKDLHLGCDADVTLEGFLLKPAFARMLQQVTINIPDPGPGPKPDPKPDPDDDTDDTKTPQYRHFYLHADLDNSPRLVRSVSQIVEEVLNHLDDEGMRLSISLEVNGTASSPISEDTRRIVEENCKVLKISTYEFSED